jgi:quinol-cytochrome oxidoreductase complex cytochrome b subunit
VAGLEFESIPILAFGLLGAILLLVPFLDRGITARGRSPAFTVLGVVALVYVVGMTAWGYRSLLPVYVVLGTGLALGPFLIAAARAEKRDPPP